MADYDITNNKAAPPPCENNTTFLNELNKYRGRFKALSNTPVKKNVPVADEQSWNSWRPEDLERSEHKKSSRPWRHTWLDVQGMQQPAYLQYVTGSQCPTVLFQDCCHHCSTLKITCLNDFCPVAPTLKAASKGPHCFHYSLLATQITLQKMPSSLYYISATVKKTPMQMVFVDFISSFKIIIQQHEHAKLVPMGLSTLMCKTSSL